MAFLVCLERIPLLYYAKRFGLVWFGAAGECFGLERFGTGKPANAMIADMVDRHGRLDVALATWLQWTQLHTRQRGLVLLWYQRDPAITYVAIP